MTQSPFEQVANEAAKDEQPRGDNQPLIWDIQNEKPPDPTEVWLIQNGITFDTTTENGKSTTKYYIEDESNRRYELLSSDRPTTEAQTVIQEWRDAKVEELEKTYHIQISRDGMQATPAWKKEPVDTRTPNPLEIVALERALSRGAPSTNFSHDGKPVNIAFPKFRTTFVSGYYEHDAPSGPQIIVEPAQRDVETLQIVGIHEFAHHGYYNMQEWSDEKQKKTMQELGWQEGEKGWLLQGRDGHSYLGDRDRNKYFRVNEKGEYLDAANNVTSDVDKAVGFDPPEMRELALKHPPTAYFLNEREAIAESLTLLRTSEIWRARLHQNDPSQYDAVKKFDQAEIDAAYGLNEDGTSKLIRNPDGLLRENNMLNRLVIREFESKLKAGKYEMFIPPEYKDREPLNCTLC